MIDVEQLVPTRERVDVIALTRRIVSQIPALPFDDAAIGQCAKFSRAIFEDSEARRYPELQALAFRMRKSELVRMRAAFQNLRETGTEPAPRGIVFHIPPANVDTIFAYCWMFSALAGNINVIRLPERAGAAAEILCRLLAAIEGIGESTTIVRYGHDAAATAALSKIADVRVIWGGDGTVDQIRRIPIPAHATELTFADRSSLSVLDANRYLALLVHEQIALAGKFFNDAFWFDQMACSSPRSIVWRGSEWSTSQASTDFAERLAAEVNRRQYVLADAARMARFTFECRAILEAPVTRSASRPELTLLDVDAPGDLPIEHSGGGLFFQWRIENTGELAPFLDRRHQTLTHFGFEEGELRELARTLRGRAIDRMVPIGQALEFHRFWDGHDLLREFTRMVHVDAAAGG